MIPNGKMANEQRIWVDEKAPIPKVLGALGLMPYADETQGGPFKQGRQILNHF